MSPAGFAPRCEVCDAPVSAAAAADQRRHDFAAAVRCGRCVDVEARFAAAYPGVQPTGFDLRFYARNGRRPGDRMPAAPPGAPSGPAEPSPRDPTRHEAREAEAPTELAAAEAQELFPPYEDGAVIEGFEETPGVDFPAAASYGSPATPPAPRPAPRPAATQSNPGGTRQMNQPIAPPSGAPAAPPASRPAAPPPATVPPNGPGTLAVPTTTRSLAPGAIGIAPARKGRGFMRVALISPSHGGKSYSSLQLARGMVEGLGKTVDRRGPNIAWWNYDVEPGGPARVLVLDTEGGSASLYDHLYPFDVIELTSPYTYARYRQAYDQAVAGAYDVLIIDSGSHLWAGEGGILQMVDATPGDKRQAWAKATPHWEGFKTGIILNARLNVIVCFRGDKKVEVVNGKRVVVSMDPIARKEVEFEFDVAFDLEHGSHAAVVGKDRTGLFVDRLPTPLSVAEGRAMMDWRMKGREDRAALASPIAAPAGTPAAALAAVPGAPPSAAQRDAVKALREKLGITLDDAKIGAGLDPTMKITLATEAEQLLAHLRELEKAAGTAEEGL